MSSNAALSPRGADIMPVGGGIVRFGSAREADGRLLTSLGPRTATSLDDLLFVIDSTLSLNTRELLLQNRSIYDEYRRTRLEVGVEFAGALSWPAPGHACGGRDRS